MAAMTLGWDDAWDDAWRGVDPDRQLTAVRIAAEHRGAYQALAIDDPRVAWIELTGKAFHDAADKRALPTVGDWVLVERWSDAVAGNGAAVIRHLLPRRTLLVRRAAGEATVPQPLAANVDVGIIVTSANRDLSLPRLDRYVGLLREAAIEALIAVSKLDLANDGGREVLARASEIGPPVIGVSAITGVGLAELRDRTAGGRTIIVVGSSGVGKSTLLNALAGADQPTQTIRDDERGRHTTTRRQMFVAPSGAIWIDTPGMRELAAWIGDDDEAEDELAFDDIAALAGTCRFRDCEHRNEPGCAVREAVPADRLASFHKLASERARRARQQAAAERIAATRRARRRRDEPDQ